MIKTVLNTHRTGADILLARVDDIHYSTTAIHVRSGLLAVLILTPVPTVIPHLLCTHFITSSLASLKWDTIVLIFEIWALTHHTCSKCRDIGLAKFNSVSIQRCVTSINTYRSSCLTDENSCCLPLDKLKKIKSATGTSAWKWLGSFAPCWLLVQDISVQ